jgi:hypothetical protein
VEFWPVARALHHASVLKEQFHHYPGLDWVVESPAAASFCSAFSYAFGRPITTCCSLPNVQPAIKIRSR